MRSVKALLTPFASTLFSIPIGWSQSEAKILGELYRQDFNGGLFWGRSLLLRPIITVAGAPLAIAEWNRDELWKSGYGDLVRDVLFFAEDAFGLQFGIRDRSIVQFDPETGAIDVVGSGPLDWCNDVISDPATKTGSTVLDVWEKQHGAIPVGFRLVPRQPFMLGGEFLPANMICKGDVEGMKVRAQLWQLTKDVPDGMDIVFRIE